MLGAVKITPAHDANDYDLGKRHNLAMLTIFSDDGQIVGDCGQFTGMKRFEARKSVLQALEEAGLYRGTADNPMVVPVCSRSKDIVEPMIKPQWYVKCDQMAAEAVRSGQLKIVPEMHQKTWFNWMDNIRDWCISRQLWSGHRIPAYFAKIDDSTAPVGDEAGNHFWVSGRSETEARTNAAKRFNVPEGKIKLKRIKMCLTLVFVCSVSLFRIRLARQGVFSNYFCFPFIIWKFISVVFPFVDGRTGSILSDHFAGNESRYHFLLGSQDGIFRPEIDGQAPVL